MTVPAGTFSTYDSPTVTGGDREDLSDLLYDVSPTETPFVTACKKGKASATNHEWLTDVLADAAANKAIEGDDAVAVQPAGRVRLGNYTQILTKTAIVSGTQEKVLKGGGIKSEMAYQVARRMKEMKRDLEYTLLAANQIKVAGSEAVAREMASFTAYLAGDAFYDGGSGAVSPTGNGVDLMSGTLTPGAFTETKLKDALQQMWENNSNENIMMFSGAKQRSLLSAFTGSSTRYADTDNKKLVASIDVYDGDYQTVTVAPTRYCDLTKVFLVDPDFVEISDLRPMFSQDLAVTGDSAKKQIIWETTLSTLNPLAHVQIVNLT